MDFVGYTNIDFLSTRGGEPGQVRRVLAAGGVAESELQQCVGGRRLFIRVKSSGESASGTAARIEAVLREAFPRDPFVVESSNEVGPVVGQELQQAAVWAVLISLVGIVTYIAWRFEFRFGVAATVATFHDVLVVLGIFFLLDKEITLLIVTLAVLALLLFGGEVLRDFSLALAIGIIVGSYSSIFVASALVYEWRMRTRRHAVGVKKQAQSLP